MTDTNRCIDPSHEKRLKTRDKGVGKAYGPFIKVHELSSQGENVRIRSASVGRVHHLLSGIELFAFLVFGVKSFSGSFSFPKRSIRSAMFISAVPNTCRASLVRPYVVSSEAELLIRYSGDLGCCKARADTDFT